MEHISKKREQVEVTPQTVADLMAIVNAWTITARHGLGPEVIYSAMKFYRENPTITVEDAIKMGLEEWDV